jgi:hypothetical protein
MNYDIFELRGIGMTWYDRAWRVALLLGCIGALLYDMFVGRPG